MRTVGSTTQALGQVTPIPCSTWSYAVATSSGSVMLNAATLVDSYDSSTGAYGGQNVGSGAIVQSADSITNNGGVVNGQQRQHTASTFPAIPVPATATNLPLGSSAPGSLNINTAADSITLPPGNYVAANINVNFPGALNIAPGGEVRIWVTGNLNLGGNENLNGAPQNLAFIVTSSGWVNVNSNGKLYGMIYAPTSGVNINSSIFGSAIGSSVTLNSHAAVHSDLSATCPQITTTTTPSGPDRLPAPPTQPGCYMGSLRGWLPVPCKDPKLIFPGFQSLNINHDGLGTVPGGTAPPFVYGQVQATVESIGSEKNFAAIGCDAKSPCADTKTCPASGVCACNAQTCASNTCDSSGRCSGGSQWGIQNNTNEFRCASGTAECVVQFAAIGDGVNGNSAVCIETWQIPDVGGIPKATVDNFCVGVDGTTTTGDLTVFTDTRKGPLQAGDFGNVAGHAFTAGGVPMMAVVAQFSWVSNQDVVPDTEVDLPNRIPGLYAVVTQDTLGLAGGWTRATGGIMGMMNSSAATFTDAAVLTRVAASSCPDDVSAAGPTCFSVPAFTAANVQHTVESGIATLESNNLVVAGVPSVAIPNANLAITSYLATTNVPAGAAKANCLASQQSHLFVTDHEGDQGGVPSNVGGMPFWESPDIFVVPDGAAVPTVNDTPADLQLVAGASYQVYLRVHNEFGCQDVTGPISVFIDAADPNMGFANWQKVTDGADQGKYATFGAAGSVIAPKFGAGIIGPFPWSPSGSGHKCLLAAVAGNGEAAPPASATAPVLPPAYSSNQIAQRNVQIGSECSYSITNTTDKSANLVMGISVTPAKPVPGSADGPSVTLVFGDPGGAWAAEWQGLPGLSSVTNDGTKTTIALSSSYVALTAVPLAAGQSPSVTLQVNSSDTPPTVNVSAILSDPLTGNILQQNGGSCTGTEIVIPK